MKRLIGLRDAAAWMFAGACVLGLIAVFVFVLVTITTEGVKRRDQTCQLFERQELMATMKVVRLYAYLDRLPRAEYGTNFTREIVKALPETREDAEASIAPAYCNEAKGAALVGLPETPKYQAQLPAERDFSRLLTK